MPWTADDPPSVAKNWTADERRKCVAAANAVLKDGGSDQDAIFACIHAAGKGNNDKGAQAVAHEYKTFPALTTKVDAEQGIVESVVAVFGNLDLGNDVIHPGAFAKSIAERGLKVRVLDQHQTDSIMRVIGKPLAIREVGRSELPPELLAKCPEATGGLFTITQYLLDTPEGKGAFLRIKAGAIDEFSIGYDALDVDYSAATKDGRQVTARNLRTCRLWEYSPVIWGMNPATATVSAKAAEEDAVSKTTADQAKAADFATTFQGRMTAQALDEQHWQMRRALEDAIETCMMDEQMAPDAKLGLIATSIDQYKAAMLDWCTRALAAMSQAQAAGTSMEMMAASVGFATKAGARHSADDMRMLNAIHDHVVALGASSCPGTQKPAEGEGKSAPPAEGAALEDKANNGANGHSAEAGPGANPPTSNERAAALLELEQLDITLRR